MVWYLRKFYHIITVNNTSIWMQYDFLALCQLFATANVIVLGLLCLVALAVKIVRFGVWQGALGQVSFAFEPDKAIRISGSAVWGAVLTCTT